LEDEVKNDADDQILHMSTTSQRLDAESISCGHVRRAPLTRISGMMWRARMRAFYGLYEIRLRYVRKNEQSLGGNRKKPWIFLVPPSRATAGRSTSSGPADALRFKPSDGLVV
jgi:hypothetical protein